MTRLLATGDLHVGAGLGYADDRVSDQARVLGQIAAIAQAYEVDAVLLAGDVFHRPTPPIPALHAFRRFLDQLDQAEIPVVAVVGNKVHDVVNADEPCALELFDHGTVAVRVRRAPDVVGLSSKGRDGLAVACLPNVPLDRLVAAHGSRDTDVNAHAVALLLEQAAELRERCGDWPAVLLGHWSVTGATLPNGLPSEALAGEPVLPLDALEAQGWDVIVMGHLHQPQRIGRCSVYTGSPQTVDFGEAHVPHGVWIVDTDATTEAGRFEFVPVADRPFVTLDLTTLGEAPEDTMASLHADLGFDAGQLTAAVVRVRIACTEEQATRIDQHELRRALADAGAHRVWAIDVQVERAARARVDRIDTSTSLPDQIRMWAGAAALEAGDLEQLMALAGEIGGAR